MALGWCGVQAALNAMLAAVTATVPDQVPVGRRGRVGGILAVAQTSASSAAPASRRRPAASPPATWRPRRAAGAAVPYSLSLARHRAAARGAAGRSTYAGSCASFWVSPRSYPDFAWAWLTRFLVNLGNALGLLYLLYFLQDVIGYSSDEAEDRVFVLTAIYAAHAGADRRRLRRLERPAAAGARCS